MSKTFKEFYSANTPQQPPMKWNVILFTGEFDPVCKEEFHRIKDYIKNYVGSKREAFDENADLGLLTPSSSENEINTKMKYSLTFEERQYIAGKFFGFKMFPIDFKEMFSLAHFDKKKKLSSEVNSASTALKDNFDNANILIVIRPNEATNIQDIKEITHVFSNNGLNIGFMTYEHTPIMYEEYFKKIPMTGKMIKACCLLDGIRPSALELKNFAYKYNLQDSLDSVKLMHFLTKNEKYDMVFRHIFPDIRLHERTNEEFEFNTKTVMEVIKKMYTDKI
jgi:hypothetical protein